jgi:hypothetical protein
MKTNEEFLKEPTNCPNCNSTLINESSPVESAEGKGDITMYRGCNKCGCRGYVHYTAADYTVQFTPPLRLKARWVVSLDGNVVPATARDVGLDYAFIGLYQQNPETDLWEWLSDYENLSELERMTGIISVETMVM